MDRQKLKTQEHEKTIVEAQKMEKNRTNQENTKSTHRRLLTAVHNNYETKKTKQATPTIHNQTVYMITTQNTL